METFGFMYTISENSIRYIMRSLHQLRFRILGTRTVIDSTSMLQIAIQKIDENHNEAERGFQPGTQSAPAPEAYMDVCRITYCAQSNITIVNESMDIDRSIPFPTSEEPMELSTSECSYEESQMAMETSLEDQNLYIEEEESNPSLDEEKMEICQKQCNSSDDDYSFIDDDFTDYKRRKMLRKQDKFNRKEGGSSKGLFFDEDIKMVPVDTKPKIRSCCGQAAYMSHPNYYQNKEEEQESICMADNEHSSDDSADTDFVIYPLNKIISVFLDRRPPPGFPVLPQYPPLIPHVHTDEYVQKTPIIPPAPSPMRHLYYDYPEFMENPQIDTLLTVLNKL